MPKMRAEIREKIVRMINDGCIDAEIAKILEVDRKTVAKIRREEKDRIKKEGRIPERPQRHHCQG